MIEIVRADITALAVDAIVNAANPQLAPGGGVCGAIYRAAGPDLVAATAAMGGCRTGGAVLTPGFHLRAPFIVHAVGPVWHGGHHDERDLLRATYVSAFEAAAAEPRIRSIAFPAISTGIYGFPKTEAAAIALEVMRRYELRFDRVIACLFDDDSVEQYRRLTAS